MKYNLQREWQEKVFELRNFQGIEEDDSNEFSPEIVEAIILNPAIYDELMIANALLPYVQLDTKALVAILHCISTDKKLKVTTQSIKAPSTGLGKRLLGALSEHVVLFTEAIKIIAVFRGEENELVSYSI